MTLQTLYLHETVIHAWKAPSWMCWMLFLVQNCSEPVTCMWCCVHFVSCRKKDVVLTQLLQSIIIAVLIGTVFMQIGTTQSSVVRRQPVLFFCVINQGIFAALVSTSTSYGHVGSADA
jgi:hypothetical protein